MKYALELIKNSIHQNMDGRGRKFLDNQMFRLNLPYLLRKLEDGKFIPLNRDYKPLGVSRGNWAVYEEYDFLFLDPDKINTTYLWDNDEGHSLYFYSDCTYPFKDKRNFSRYQSLIDYTFFYYPQNPNHKFIFDDLWFYKKQHDRDGYENNILRITKGEQDD